MTINNEKRNNSIKKNGDNEKIEYYFKNKTINSNISQYEDNDYFNNLLLLLLFAVVVVAVKHFFGAIVLCVH